jgi:hypothetical protein
VTIAAIVTGTDGTSRTIRVTVDETGRRTTEMPEPGSDRRAAIAIYGGSTAFGDALSDEETIPWQAAALLPGYRIVNRAVPGYGVAQAVTRLLDDLASDNPPAAVVLVNGSPTAEGVRGGRARFPLSERSALWQAVDRLLSRMRAPRLRARAIRSLSERQARLGIPVVWIDVPAGTSAESAAAVLARDVRAALEVRQQA